MAEAKLAGTMIPGPMWPLIGRMEPGQARVLDTRIRRNEDSSFTVSFTSPVHRAPALPKLLLYHRPSVL